MAQEKCQIDEVTVSVVWNKLMNITREVGERVVHGAQSYVMANARDLGPVLLDKKGHIVCQVEYLPCHCLVAEIPTQAILKKFGDLDKGDMVLGNDGHILKSGHLPDWTFLVPVYYGDELVFYYHFRGHMADSGGAFSGSYFPQAYDCISEGINIPPIKLIEKGKIDEKAKEIIFDNIRTSAAVWTDCMVIFGSIQRAQEDIRALIDKYGLDTVKGCCDEMMVRGEKAMRAEIKQIPEGEYTGECAVDSDGTVMDRPAWVRVKLTVKGDEMTFDFSDSMNQVDFVNSPLGNTHCFTYFPIFYATDPDLPHNHGALIPIHIIAPEGKIVNPTRPATYGACGCSTATEITDAVTQALSKATEKAQGVSSRHYSVDVTGRVPIKDPRSGQDIEFFAAPFLEEGGSGAVKGHDGWDGMCGTILTGVVLRGSVEICELIMPFYWEWLNLSKDKEGAGEFIGARGCTASRWCTAMEGARTILMAGDASGTLFPPAGAGGAPYAPTGDLYLKRAGKTELEFFPTMSMAPMYAGDILYTECMGAGGWGEPLNRDPEKIKLDVRDELISVERARNVYGVVIDPKSLTDNPEDVAVDQKATGALRKKLRIDPRYRHPDLVREDVRAGKISVQEARDKYAVIIKEDDGRQVIDYKATEKFRPH
jgi:N-methylhydantoinase B